MADINPREAYDGSSLTDIEKGDALREKDDIPSNSPTPAGSIADPTSKEIGLNDKNQETESQPQVNISDWNGPNDPDNPQNWPTWIKVYHATVPGLFGFAVTFGSSVYTPATADIEHQFGVSRTAAIVGLTVYVMGLAAGPIFSAPLSEAYGRKVVYITSSPIFMLFTLGAGFSQSFASLMVCRFFAGLTGSPALAVGAGTSADLFVPRQRAVVTSMFLAAPFAGPSLGPVVGGFAAQYKGWRWTQWCMEFVTLAVFIMSLFTKETFKPVVLKQRAKKLGLKLPPGEAAVSAKAMKSSLVKNFFQPLHMLFIEPIVFLLSLYTAFAFAVLFVFFAAFPYVFQRPPYNFTISQYGLTFLGIGFGVLLGALTGVLIDRVIYQKQHQKAVARGEQHAAPEHRLYNMMFGSIGIPVGLFWFAWAAQTGCHWIVLVIAAVPFAWGNICLFTSAALYMVDVYGPRNAGSAIAANGILRYTLGATFPLFTVQMYQRLDTGWATSLLGFLALLMLPIPYVFFKWGPAIRKRSRYPVVM
ncbi:MFS general substrate transporter [Amniculicola lignicola CBS 123094]|uniref:MFS general substrate transporter n=1 Tax=Amniculicola lignicola CBS 123094 TaxID=1392246 RepID=A0A6A5X555_9PLEO|nr:MFS general substrate transporter [Amniculicola lignicola CBS 123094]